MSEVAAQLDETSTSATPTPSNPINGKPAVVRIKRRSLRRQQQKDKKRTPLADLTNATSSSSPRLHLEEREPDPKSALPPPSLPTATSVPGAEGEHGGTSVVPTPPQGVKESFLDPGELYSVFPSKFSRGYKVPRFALPNCPFGLFPECSGVDASGDGGTCNKPVHSVVYTRSILKGTKSKGKEPCTTSSCPPAEKIRTVNGKLMGDAIASGRKAFSVPFEKRKKLIHDIEVFSAQFARSPGLLGLSSVTCQSRRKLGNVPTESLISAVNFLVQVPKSIPATTAG
ncbi:hypothetical protein B296_00035589 [Ensete ventricosum]|uniref:Uncharacterized protein n=1 Tax=Ensete ventricosum TaxID=4639 RepID=A0A426YC47_ENSVE|nr:hypothetical protein B296_00035589 [Ensete ventricosum]